MKRNDSISLTLPANAAYIPTAIFATKECAGSTGFAADDIGRISLAIEEGMSHAIEFGYGGPQETVQIDIARTSLGLKMTIQFHGLPLEVEHLPKYNPERVSEFGDTTGISLLLIEKMLDKASFSSLPNGIRTVSMEKYLPAQLVSEVTAQTSLSIQPKDVQYELRLAKPHDAEAISRLAFQSHGAVLFCEHIYYPDRVREMIESKEMTSTVIETNDGAIIGHGALVRYSPDGAVEELTYGFVDPNLRCLGCASKLATFLEDNARQRRRYAISVCAVTNHVHSQRAILSHGYKECGLLLDTSPASHSWGREGASHIKRIGNLLFTKYLNGFRNAELHIPEHHKQMIERIYAQSGISIKTSEIQEVTIPPDSESNIWTLSDFKEGWAAIGVIQYGADIAAQVNGRLQHALTQEIASIQLALPLTDSATLTATALFEDMGFFFAGVGADDYGNENILLQYVNATAVAYDEIQVHSEFAQEIKSYIQSCDPRLEGQKDKA